MVLIWRPGVCFLFFFFFQDSNGAILIDQDPRYFSCILNFLRYNTPVVDPSLDIDGVLACAEYFQIQALVKILKERTQGVHEKVFCTTLVSQLLSLALQQLDMHFSNRYRTGGT